MKRIATIFFAACLVGLVPFQGLAQEQKESEYGETSVSTDTKESAMEVPPGMELRKIGTIKMVVPKGTQVSKKGSLVVMEGPDEYAARNIYEMNGRLMGLEARQMNIERETESLKQTVLELQRKLAAQNNNQNP